MANITISDLALSVDSESFLTDLSELNEQDMASIMGNIIGGDCTTTTIYRRNGTVKKTIKVCDCK